ncbi:tRNA (N6-threonylcarbamoyladenosine(37)-N6)-methyltransferase TrmO [Parashewanella spongiae]|uniref:tRNA (N6-threonylcarbamoyladenosine(37)-N6)-methyltransferase TrmO n=1 Tax=Parashewanella spongiae TaxID=342950 RepID=A0A3A6TX74_9GAMM|nr:tRNA (N6-threonylcarbamoyladenosine(37)-N6)-methyltransferase TrmO [Parashewanella spongiae]MCL1079640.1 tRNA (N6-threonylcarbamoyladenosine(37)-N6)-methyltransferase TrmO [Parashewanella spongiae]RJY19079.1 tRNA (N6-threonylcarbamoyladenosine(37)-N6)-methyltransferase TrmO [Parashewanella spongiae]
MINFKHSVEAIGVCHSPYKQKFGIPRQPGLVDAKGTIELIGDYNHPDFVEGIEQYSHLWLIFSFHENLTQGFKAKVRPPRLGGNDKMGVLATRSTFRPNGIGQSVVRLHSVNRKNGQIRINISGMDLVDSTPILDIKPYLPFSDNIQDATAGFAQQAPQQLDVHFSQAALQTLSEQTNHYEVEALISQVLSQDPRPAYKKNNEDCKIYHISLYELNISWQVVENIVIVKNITNIF